MLKTQLFQKKNKSILANATITEFYYAQRV